MFTFTRQIQIASDFVKSAPSRLAGIEAPRWEDKEQTFAELQARIQRAPRLRRRLQARAVRRRRRAREIEIKTPNRTLNFNGSDYLLNFALPNFYFHLTMAYAILRHNGLEIAQASTISAVSRRHRAPGLNALRMGRAATSSSRFAPRACVTDEGVEQCVDTRRCAALAKCTSIMTLRDGAGRSSPT